MFPDILPHLGTIGFLCAALFALNVKVNASVLVRYPATAISLGFASYIALPIFGTLSIF